MQLLVEHDCKILACAGSNVAVDNLLSALVKARVKAYRVGNRIRKDLEAHSLECIAKRQLESAPGYAGASAGSNRQGVSEAAL